MKTEQPKSEIVNEDTLEKNLEKDDKSKVKNF